VQPNADLIFIRNGDFGAKMGFLRFLRELGGVIGSKGSIFRVQKRVKKWIFCFFLKTVDSLKGTGIIIRFE
jgi:hypothetical protein